MDKSIKSEINKESVIPLYFQVKEIIKNQIHLGVLETNSIIPSERELAELFEINRLTVRQAINELVHEGILYRQRGIGTFVSSPKIEQGLKQLTNFTSEMKSRGLEPGAQVVSKQKVFATKQIASKLQINEGDEVVELIRVRTADGEPVALEKVYLSVDVGSTIIDMDMENVSLYQVLKDVCGLTLVRAIQSIEVTNAYPEEAGILEVSTQSALMMINRITYREGSALPVEYVHSLYRADRYKFVIEMNV